MFEILPTQTRTQESVTQYVATGLIRFTKGAEGDGYIYRGKWCIHKEQAPIQKTGVERIAVIA
jgi:hypothetical protein